MKKMEKWRNHTFASDVRITPEFSAFARDFKKYVKDSLPEGSTLEAFSRGHFYISGFIRRKNLSILYFSISDVRHFPNEWADRLLVRSAKSATDYSGGINRFIKLEQLAEVVEKGIGEEE